MTKIVAISDTHGRTIPNLPKGDILISAGDWSGRGTFEETFRFIRWMESIRNNYKHIVCVPGNHDRWIQDNLSLAMEEFANSDLILLVDDFTIIEGIKIYGHPWTPIFHNWAFNADDKKRKKLLSNIPNDVDVLVSHGPPYGLLDELDEYGSEPGLNVGCQYLRDLVDNKSNKFQLLIAGHIHNQSGIIKHNNKLIVNAASLNEQYEIQDPYKVIYLENKK